jgi:hypothetical protein
MAPPLPVSLARLRAMHHKRAMTARPILLACLVLAACGSAPKGGASAAANEEKIIPAPEAVVEPVDAPIECAVDGAAMARVCTIEKVPGPSGLGLTVRSPSGSFRRLLVTKDGRGVAAADGAEPVRVTVIGPGRIEVAVGGDRYRLPASIQP